jgi:hypothetical protein
MEHPVVTGKGTAPPETPAHSTQAMTLTCCWIVLERILYALCFLAHPASAASAGILPSAPASMTFQQFLKEGRQDHVYRGPIQPPSGPASMPKSTSAHTTD